MNLLSSEYQSLLQSTLADLIRIPSRSTAAGGEEGDVQNYVAQRMRELGARVRTFEAADYPQFFTHPLCCGPDRNYENRPTVVGEIGPADAPALLVMAHSDTVPIFEPEKWTRDPFDPHIEDGKIYGLGAGDDKWGVAALLTLMQIFQQKPLSKRLIFASTIDEENGVANGLLLLHLAGIKAEAALYLDGHDLEILLGHLGGSVFFLWPNPVLDEAVCTRCAQDLGAACRALSTQRASLFDRNLLHDNLMRYQSICLDERCDHRGRFLALRFYTVEGEDPTTVQAELEKLIEDTLGENAKDYRVVLRDPWFEPAFTDSATPFVEDMAEACRDILCREPKIGRISKQDAFVMINHAGVPTISFGAARSQSPGAYHEPDEFVELRTSETALNIVSNAICRWAQSPQC
jgi:acetylornithine deacetylase/succinyl-diaminopimelate desuccinylase-like protein